MITKSQSRLVVIGIIVNFGLWSLDLERNKTEVPTCGL